MPLPLIPGEVPFTIAHSPAGPLVFKVHGRVRCKRARRRLLRRSDCLRPPRATYSIHEVRQGGLASGLPATYPSIPRPFAILSDQGGFPFANHSDPVTTRQTLNALLSRRILVMDGAMGTMIQSYRLDEAGFRGQPFPNHPKDLKG